MGSLMHDNAYLEGANSPEASFTFYYLVPLPVFEELFPGQGYRQLAVDIDHSQQSSFEAFLSQYEQDLNRGISVTMRSDYQQNFENSRLNMVLILGMVGAVLLLIALLNFVNLLVTKTVSRRREFAVYPEPGMTLSQLAAAGAAGRGVFRPHSGRGFGACDHRLCRAGNAGLHRKPLLGICLHF